MWVCVCVCAVDRFIIGLILHNDQSFASLLAFYGTGSETFAFAPHGTQNSLHSLQFTHFAGWCMYNMCVCVCSLLTLAMCSNTRFATRSTQHTTRKCIFEWMAVSISCPITFNRAVSMILSAKLSVQQRKICIC